MRNIFIVNATQVVVSEQNPQGAYSVVSGYPKTYDSRNYGATEQNPNGNADLALIVAQADYADTVKALSLSHNRAGWAVTLERWDGVQLDKKSMGSFPVDPEPEPTPEPEGADE